jgi:hypothetical protein
MWELFNLRVSDILYGTVVAYMALEGIQPTFKQVPPGTPRLSIQTVYLISMNPRHRDRISLSTAQRRKKMTHLQTGLSSLDSGNISTRSTTEDSKIIRLRLGS